MKKIDCPEHGNDVAAIVIDSLLLRYKCVRCIRDEKEEEAEDSAS